MKNPLHNPLPASLSSECKKAAAILESFINPKLKIDGDIPRKIFAGAKGIAIFTAFRVGFLGSVRFGSGLIVARLSDGSWSAPSAMAMGSLGAGGQFGAELTDFVFVLTTDAAVKTFMQSGNLTLGGNISMAVGPIGRSAEAGGVVGTKSATGVFAYSKTRGLYGGLTVEGGVLAERADANKKLYGRKIRAKELLSGSIPPPPEAGALVEVLNGGFFRVEGTAEPASEGTEQTREQNPEASAQLPELQSQGILAPAANQPVAVESSAEQAPGTAGLPTRDSPCVFHELDAQETTPVAESKPAIELDTEEATGDAGLSNEITHTHKSDVPEPISTADHVSTVEPSTQLEPKGKEPATGDTHHTSRDSGVPGPMPATERLSDHVETAPSMSR
ncbi:unnamed protein product [Penicillium nalgiovense]|uniref:Ysc84 actin-binding domain-containing protein n=1 Tax=Penicillium nalgiovense TaxID=60175 RepID=A0A1V6YJQ7_PENNA|nr:hypothetical protein PENNAL_c0019G02196 [Penicillium nalgiovense]CAG8039298.1 unnamed protein product [Penicillium nalgiovense]CAG8068916.1 unnamed protein product [Penicillium nalgiovense]CAG8092033.1 unnamed protein product [Penicillium nalgiovense]CAG8096076.1 unnamed protein product [Penicillium nalgiovense]